MADKIEDGGPAYPLAGLGDYKRASGMSLRDWFAGQALAGLVGNPGGPYQSNSMSGWGMVNCDQSHVATNCYDLADAMIAARKAGA